MITRDAETLPGQRQRVDDHLFHVSPQPRVQQQIHEQKNRNARAGRRLPVCHSARQEKPDDAGPEGRLDEKTKRQHERPAVEDLLHERRQDHPPDRLEHHGAQQLIAPFQQQDQRTAEGRGVQEAEEQTQYEDHHRRSQVELAGGQFRAEIHYLGRLRVDRGRLGTGNPLPDMAREDQRHVGPAKRDHRIAGEEAAQRSAEPQRAEPLHPAQIELAAAINAVQLEGQHAVGPQQLVAADQIAHFGQVGQLEIVRQMASRRSPMVRKSPADLIQQFLGQFFAGDAFGRFCGTSPTASSAAAICGRMCSRSRASTRRWAS